MGIELGESSINGRYPIAMFDYQKVFGRRTEWWDHQAEDDAPWLSSGEGAKKLGAIYIPIYIYTHTEYYNIHYAVYIYIFPVN